MLLPSLPVADPFNVFREYTHAATSSHYFHHLSAVPSYHFQSYSSAGITPCNPAPGIGDLCDPNKRIVFIFAPLPIFVPWLFLSPPTIILPIVPSPASAEMNSNDSDKRDKTKVAIRSQLLCFKEGLTTTQLNNWYRSFFKTPIAQTTGEIEAWLTKQTDLCRSKGKTVSGEKLWVGIPTQETKHVSDLISHQKSAKPKKTKKIARQSAKFAKSIEQAPPAQKGASSSASKNSYRSSYGRKTSKPSLSRRSSNASNTSQAFQRKPVNSPVVPACAGNSMKKSYEFDRRTDHTRVFNGYNLEEDRKEYETNTITIKRPPSVVEKSYSSTPTTDSSDEESYDKNAIISSIKKAHEQMRRNGSMKSSSENHEPRPESIRSMKDEARVGSVARTDSIRSAYDLPPACVDRRTPMSSSVLGEPKEAKLESLRDDTSVAKSEVSTIRSRKYGIDEMRQFIGLELKSHGDSMSISNILGLLNDDFMSGVLKRPGLSKEKFLNVLKMFEEFYVENGRVFLQNAESTEEEEDTEEDSSESISDSGTDVSELGMFGVPKPQTTLQNTAKPAPAIESEPMSSMARQVYDAKQELAALRLRDANLHTQLVQIQNRIAENKEEMEAAQEKYEQLADEFVEGFMKAF
ncbi:Oidioi.mRNA.OKI2018_I69.chr2.g7279.t1.cds [Oikopleura dioica]|uniref:Oidioi.mRNA.OKI2018_I69.chr2.g7279.t1.cds n=1 Tax=Oikopleura dioica TaxID=34765 RepID=A0ABN7TAG3_OIKDI|nr:Oidioi.mRNA.OKI2018_I69.chr2.g7279.t1.cds [Oikopleura dioica]